jgi:hypothetical protein
MMMQRATASSGADPLAPDHCAVGPGASITRALSARGLPVVVGVLLLVTVATLIHWLGLRSRPRGGDAGVARASPSPSGPPGPPGPLCSPDAPRVGRRGASARSASLLAAPLGAAARPTLRIRIVHHGSEADTFWRDVHKGAHDARLMLRGIELQILPDLAEMPNNIRRTVAEADALIVSCPYRNTEPLYTAIDEAIRVVIASGTPVITFNTDTYHNVDVFQYVGSSNRIIGKKGALIALRKYPQVLPEGEKALADDADLSATCDLRMQAMHRRCNSAGSRKVGLVIGVLQERFNVTLDWRIEEFHREWGVQTAPFPPPKLLKTYSAREAQAAIDSLRVSHGEEVCIVVPTGVAALEQCAQLKRDNPSLLMCEVGDTGMRVSELASELDIPFVGQMQYQQGFSAVTNMYNLLVNYDRGSTWGRERGNSALTIDATYECTEDCELKGEDTIVRRQERRAATTPWQQVGVAMHLQGLDIARWDEYRKDNVGKSRRVLLADGNEDKVVVIDGARNYGAVYAEDYDPDAAPPCRMYNGMLGEWIKYYPLYERVVDRRRNRGQYFIVHERDTRLPLGDVDRVTNGAFVRTQYGATFRVLLYEQDSVISLQSLLEDTRRGTCAPCS